MRHVSPQEARRLIDQENAVLIDCRERYEWDEARIAEARLVPLSEYEGDPGRVARTETVIFQCAAGMRSQAAGAIYEAEYPGAEALNLAGGITAWAECGLPFESGAPSQQG